MNAARGKALAWLCHPVTVTALALLIINDRLLKAAWPGWVTGKLSDAAGMVLAPPLLAALAGLVAPRLPFRRVAAAAIVTVGARFLSVKLWGYGAQLASGAWSLITPSLVRADPSDLPACPFLAIAWWTAHRPFRAVPARRRLRAPRHEASSAALAALGWPRTDGSSSPAPSSSWSAGNRPSAWPRPRSGRRLAACRSPPSVYETLAGVRSIAAATARAR